MTLSALIRKRRTENFELLASDGANIAVTAITAEVKDQGKLAEECFDLRTMALVREFMEIDGLTLSEAHALAAISIQPRPAEEWRAMIADLAHLIRRYCSVFGVSSGAEYGMMSARCSQPLASIPETVAWFRDELALEKLRVTAKQRREF